MRFAMPATLNPAARVLRAAPQLGRVSREGRCRNCDDVRSAKPAQVETLAATAGETRGATLGWMLVALAIVPWLTIALLPVTATGTIFITIVALCLTFPLAAYLSERSPVARAIGLGVYVVVDVSLTLLGLFLELLSVLG